VAAGFTPFVQAMKALLFFLAWCFLFFLCWPLAVLVLLLAPFIWLAWLVLRLIGMAIEAVFALVRAVLFLPARMLGYHAAA
jgi:hypothetical protein